MQQLEEMKVAELKEELKARNQKVIFHAAFAKPESYISLKFSVLFLFFIYFCITGHWHEGGSY